MTCGEVEDKLADFVTNRLTDDENPRIRKHVEGCLTCREFAERIRVLYTLDDGLIVPPPAAHMRFSPSSSRFRSVSRWAAAACFILLAGFAVGRGEWWKLWRDGDGSSSQAETIVWQPAGFEWDHPEIPGVIAANSWLVSDEEARQQAEWTGRAILTRFVYEPCPRCIYMEKIFTTPETMSRLDTFVCLKITLDQEVPAIVNADKLAKEPRFMMPAVYIASGGRRTPVVYELASLDPVFELEADWQETFGDVLPKPLTTAQYTIAREILLRAAQAAAAGSLGTAFTALDEMRVLELQGLGGRVIEIARLARERYELSLANVVKDIEALRRGSRREQIRAEAMAAVMRQRLSGNHRAGLFQP